MDQDQRDPRDWPEGGKPEDVADEALSEEAPTPPPPEEPAGGPEPAAADEPAPTEPDWGAAAEARRRRDGERADPGRGAFLRQGG